MSEIILQTENLSKQYKQRWAVRNVNLEVRRGDVFGFLGPNGAGKSTTIRMILSLIKPAEGTVELFGHNLFREREKALQNVAGIVEKPDFYLYLSAHRNMEIAGAMTLGKKPEKKKILETLASVGLEERAEDKVKAFSHGMKQRLGIAQALLCEPQLILLDEPTNGLDPQGMKEVRELIAMLSGKRGITVFLSSHLLHEVEQVATRMAIINNGRMIVQGSVDEILHASINTMFFDVEPKKKALSVLQKLNCVTAPTLTNEGITAQVAKKDIPKCIAALGSARCKIYTVRPKQSLEEYFLAVTNNEEQHR